MIANFDEEELQAVIRSLLKKTQDRTLKWAGWGDTGLDEEYVATTPKFKYFIGKEDPGWDAPYVRLEIWKLGAASDGKSLRIHQDETPVEKNPALDQLLVAARLAALNLEDLANDILSDLDELPPP